MSTLIPNKMDIYEMDTSSDGKIDYTNAHVQARFNEYVDNEEIVRNYTNQAVINAVKTTNNATFGYCGNESNWDRFEEEQNKQLEGLTWRLGIIFGSIKYYQ